MDAAAAGRSACGPADDAVAVAGLSYAFGKGAARKPVLFDIDLVVRRGEFVILTGPSGAGKTTLLSVVGALRRPQEGSVRVLGLDLGRLTRRRLTALRRRIGFIFQDHNLFDALTARQTLTVAMRLHARRYARRDFKTRPAEMLAAVGLADHLDAKPGALSTGQKQRVAIARALINRPELILADEPTASLDAGTGDDVIALLKRAAVDDGASVVMVTHDSRIFAVADRVVELMDGRIVGAGASVSTPRNT